MKIIQIIPADNWRAVYKSDGAEPAPSDEILVCWALVDSEPKVIGTEIRGMVADGSMIIFADDAKNFAGYRCV
jgi:hypothetical protein